MDARDISIIKQVAAKAATDLVPFANPTANGVGDVIDTYQALFDGISQSLLTAISGESDPKPATGNNGNTFKPSSGYSKGTRSHNANNSDNVVNAERAFGSKTEDGPIFVQFDGETEIPLSDIPQWAVKKARQMGAAVVKDERGNKKSPKGPDFRVTVPSFDKDGIWAPDR